MALTQSTEVLFQSIISDSADQVTLQVTSTFSASVVSWVSNENRGLVTITAPNSSTPYYENLDVTAPDITASSLTISAVSTSADTVTISSHGLVTGDAVCFRTTGAIGGLTDQVTYYAILVDSNTLKLASSRANAIAGTAIDLTSSSGTNFLDVSHVTLNLPVNSDGNIVAGVYTIRVTLFDVAATSTQVYRDFTLDYTYASPSVSLSGSYSVINPVELASTDATDYVVGGVTPTITRTHTLYYPQNLGSYTVTTASLTTGGFYQGNPATHRVTLLSVLEYAYATGYYADATSTLVTWYVADSINGTNEIAVYGDSKGCDLYCCLKALQQRVAAAVGTISYNELKEKFEYASALAAQITRAYECDKVVDVNTIRAEFDRVTNCSNTCGDGDVTAVVGIGDTPIVTRKGISTLTATASSLTVATLAGRNYDNGDFLIFIDGSEVDSTTGYTITFNSVSGAIGFGVSLPSGTKIKWQIV